VIEPAEGEELPLSKCLYNYDAMITRACARIEQISDGERVMGYCESADTYKVMAAEFRENRVWTHDVMAESWSLRASE
jgi:hypothetical protein